MRNVIALILGGGHGRGLIPLTSARSTPAVPIAGKYRLIDIPMSNCINSDIRRIYVLTQILSASVHSHLKSTYRIDPFSNGFVEILAAQQTYDDDGWYSGTADAIRQHLHYLEEDDSSMVLVLSADQLYHMNYQTLIDTHRRHKAEVTISVTPVNAEDAQRFGVVQMSDHQRITGLVEKPSEDRLEALAAPTQWLQDNGIAEPSRKYPANMGIYLFNRKTLIDMIKASPDAKDLVVDLFAPQLKDRRIHAHLFKGYWRDVGTIAAYHEANLALTGDDPQFDFHTPEGVIYTRRRYLPPARVHNAVVERCLLSDGVVIQTGTEIRHSVIGTRSRIGAQVQIHDSVVIGFRSIESQQDQDANRLAGIPDLGIGDRTVIKRAILDKDCRIGSDVQIINKDNLDHLDHENYSIRDGIVVIPKSSVIANGTVI